MTPDRTKWYKMNEWLSCPYCTALLWCDHCCQRQNQCIMSTKPRISDGTQVPSPHLIICIKSLFSAQIWRSIHINLLNRTEVLLVNEQRDGDRSCKINGGEWQSSGRWRLCVCLSLCREEAGDTQSRRRNVHFKQTEDEHRRTESNFKWLIKTSQAHSQLVFWRFFTLSTPLFLLQCVFSSDFI